MRNKEGHLAPLYSSLFLEYKLRNFYINGHWALLKTEFRNKTHRTTK